ncbi:hypothetical protein BSG1_04690 [Bacillus sp. SG-1]|nr:hypothetical protein BSG1_04690 [Bacillus sp. SG-1]
MIIIVNYMILAVLSYLFNSTVNWTDIGAWGLVTGFLLLISALPLHKIIYFGGKGIMGVQSPEIPPDEHLHEKFRKSYEAEKENKLERKYQDIATIAGAVIIFISLILL